MQPNNRTAPATPATIPTFDYPPGLRPVYAIAESTTRADLENLLTIRLAHLDALMVMTYGTEEGGFNSYGDKIKDDYLWACSNMARECRELFRQIEARRAA